MKKFKKTLAVISAICTTTCLASSLTITQAYEPNEMVTEQGINYIPHETYVEVTGCEAFVSDVVIPEEIDGLPVTEIADNAFEFAYGSNFSLKSVSLPDTITKIGAGAFSGSYHLETFNIPKNVQTIGDGFIANSHVLESIQVDDENPYFSEKDGILFSEDGTKLLAFPAGLDKTDYDVPENVTKIAPSAFYGCEKLEEITLNDNIEEIGSSAFINCMIKSIEIPDGVSKIPEKAFFDCPSLVDVSLPETITEIGTSAFSHCTNLKNINLPNTITTFGYTVFDNCKELEYITLPNNITSIESGMFRMCRKLKDVTIPDNFTEIPAEMFLSCNSIENIEIPKNVTSIEYNAFYCTSINSISIPEGVTYIGYSAFEGCSELENIDFPKSLKDINYSAFGNIWSPTKWYTNQPDGLIYINDVLYEYKGMLPDNSHINVKEGTTAISNNAFRCQSGLKSISIPESVNTIYFDAFSECKNLTDITILNPNCTIFESDIPYDISTQINNNTTLFGLLNSTASEYACNYDKKFIPLNGDLTDESEQVLTQNTLRGDISSNNVIDLYDAIEIAKYLVNAENYDEETIKNGDYNGDGITDLYDAIEIAKTLIK